MRLSLFHLTSLPRRLALGLLGVSLLAAGSAFSQQAPGPDWWSAISRDDVSAVTSQLLRHVDPNAQNALGNPALTQSVRDQSWKVFDVLRTTPGVEIDEANSHQETALMYLCILGQTARAEALIRAGAHVNRLGWTPLHYAASKAQVETAGMLIQHGAIVNAPGPDGTTPLMMAAYSGSEAMADLLLTHGADPTMFNLSHETAATIARKRNSSSLARRLDDAAAERSARRELSVENGTAAAGATAPAAAAKPAPAAQAPATGDSKPSTRYFDLGRFDQPAAH